MTHTDYTKNILNIEDKNIYFYDDCLEIKEIKGVKTKIFHGYLTYTPEYCPNCECINESFDDIIKWNWKRNCKIKVTKACGFNTLLFLDKQRFFCKHCNKTFTATTNFVDFHKQISNDTNLNIKLELMQKGSEKDIAKRNNVSPKHVNIIMDQIAKDTLIKGNGKLPEIMGIDEFNATKDTISKLAFIIVDQTKHNIFDINNSRLSLDIEKYFKRYSKDERDKVKFITMDLYKPYYTLMQKLFKNAILISDRFHIALQIRNALDNTRVKLCTKSNPNYKKLKKYWKLILKSEEELDDENKKYNKHFQKEMTQKDIVTYLINTDTVLYNDYQIYQGILKSIDKRDKIAYLNIVNNNIHSNNISSKMKKALKTFSNMEKYILNAFDYEYSNGMVEGTNNVIKQIKHAACGYKKFSHLKARVMLIKGLYNPIKQN
jgi:transposase for ISSha1